MAFSSVPRATSGMSVLYLRGFRRGASAPPSTAVLDRQAQLLHTELAPAPCFLAAPSSHFLCEHHPKRGGAALQEGPSALRGPVEPGLLPCGHHSPCSAKPGT